MLSENPTPLFGRPRTERRQAADGGPRIPLVMEEAWIADRTDSPRSLQRIFL
jgi:hypothetical protein